METLQPTVKIARIWRGWTSIEDAEKLEHVLREEAIPGIEMNKPNGLKRIELLTMKIIFLYAVMNYLIASRCSMHPTRFPPSPESITSCR